MQFGVREERVMLVDKTKEIAEKKKLISDLEKKYAFLEKASANKSEEREKALKTLNNIDSIIRKTHWERENCGRNIARTRKEILTLELRQRQYEREEKIKELQTQYPSFIEIVEAKLSKLEQRQKEGLKLPLEITIDAINHSAKIKQLDTLDYYKANGSTRELQAWQNTKEAYDVKVRQDIEASFNTHSFGSSFEDFSYLAESFINDEHVRAYLGRQ